MKNNILRIIAMALVVMTLCVLCSCGIRFGNVEYPSHTEKFFVNDFAEILTEEDENAIYTSGVSLQNATTAQVIVVTVESLQGKSIDEYTTELGREWGVGDVEKNNGVVILLSESDREVYVAVGYGLEGALPDSKTGRIIDTYGISYFSNDNFSAGLLSVHNAIVNEVYIEYGMQPSENYVSMDVLEQSEQEESSASRVIISWVVMLALILIYIKIFGRRGALMVFGSGGYSHYSGGSFGGSSGGFSGGGGSFGGGGSGRSF